MSKYVKTSAVTGLELLQILFIGLKLSKVIDWSWWWILSPTWIPFSIVLIILGVIGIVKFLDR